MTRQEMKAKAKEQIKGNILMFFVVMIIVGAIESVLAVTAIGSLIVMPFLTIGLTFILFDMRDGQGVQIPRLFDSFKANQLERWLAVFLPMLFSALWSLLFVIPGIVKYYSYSMTRYIIAENPGMKATDAIDQSKKMMNGHKWEAFVLDLSFIGWYLLSGLTCGILMIYVIPYLEMSKVNFYENLKANQPAQA